MRDNSFPNLGFGLGLRAKHIPYILETKPDIDWFEIISENYMDTGGKPLRNIEKIRAHYPVVMHGVSMSIGTVDPLNSDYLKKLKNLIDRVNPAWVTDHLCWTGVAHKNTHDLLPLPYTQEALAHIVDRIKQVQDYLGRPIALENPSTYLEFKSSTMPEEEFIAKMAEQSGCYLLLDVNNVYVSCYNHRLDVKNYIDTLPLDKIVQVHLSGHTNKGTHIIDTHDDFVVDEVWNLYKYVVHKAGRVPNTMVEWDGKIPEFSVLQSEVEKARDVAMSATEFTLPDLGRTRERYISNQNTPLEVQQKTLQDAILIGASKEAGSLDWIKDKQDFEASKQLSVYTNAYRWRLFDVVAEDYPTLKSYLGEENFNLLINDFIKDVAPDHFNIARYASKLPDYQTKHATYSRAAAEICEFETTLTIIGDEAESSPLAPADLEGLNPDDLMQIKLFPRFALRLLSFSHAVNAYYQSRKDHPDRQNRLAEVPSFTVVFRHDDRVWRMDLEAQEYHLMHKIFSGESVGSALSDMDHLDPQIVMTWFSKWIRNGLFRNDIVSERVIEHAFA